MKNTRTNHTESTTASLVRRAQPLIFFLYNHVHPPVITTLNAKKTNPKAHYCLESLPTMKFPDEGEFDSRTVLLIYVVV
jgi:hypothetical protein